MAALQVAWARLATRAQQAAARRAARRERVYGELDREGAFGRLDPAALAERGRALLEAHWDGAFGDAAERTARALPVLHAIETTLWRRALERFVADDLRELSGASRVRLEHLLEGTLDLGEGRTLATRGKFDRAIEKGASRVVADYKTSGDLDARLEFQGMLRGERLQVPLYHLLAGRSPVALLGVGPAYEPEDARPAPFDGFPETDQDEGFRETLRVLSGCVARFPRCSPRC